MGAGGHFTGPSNSNLLEDSGRIDLIKKVCDLERKLKEEMGLAYYLEYLGGFNKEITSLRTDLRFMPFAVHIPQFKMIINSVNSRQYGPTIFYDMTGYSRTRSTTVCERLNGIKVLFEWSANAINSHAVDMFEYSQSSPLSVITHEVVVRLQYLRVSVLCDEQEGVMGCWGKELIFEVMALAL